MKAIIKISFFLLFPIIAFSQKADELRFTDRFGYNYEVYRDSNDFKTRKNVAYPFVREADVMWWKETWEIIDLREKVNLPLYYPIDTLHMRKSFINAVLDGIEHDKFMAFKAPINANSFEFDPNNIFLNAQEIKDISKYDDSFEVEIRTGVTRDTVVTIRWRAEEIKQILVKEVWYFDQKDSRLKCEIIGLCPIREYVFNGLTRRQRMFWIYYPDAREYFSQVPVYNTENDKPLYTYDDLFVQRYFSSYFVKEANVYNDRQISDYVIGREAQLESEKIRKEIFDFEQDLWEN